MFIFGILSIIIPFLVYFISLPIDIIVIMSIGLLITYLVSCGIRSDIYRPMFNYSEKNYLNRARPNYSIYHAIVGFSILTIPQIVLNYLMFLFLGPIYAFVIIFSLTCIGGIISYFNSKKIVSDWNSFNQEKYDSGKDALIYHIKTESYINIFITSISIPYLIVTKILSLFGILNKNSEAIKNAKG